VLPASMLQMALYVYWLKAGARSGGFGAGAFAELPNDWLANLGISLGIGLPFAVAFMLSFLLFIFGPLGWLLMGFAWFVLFVLLELYSPVVAVRARGFREALGMTVSLLRQLRRRQSLTTGAFWYPALLGLAASFVEMFVNPEGGLTSAIIAFALAAFQLPWYTSSQLVIYENVWKGEDETAEVSGDD